MRLPVFFLAFGALAVVPAMAHHSFLAEYDLQNQVSLTGVLTRVEWQSPHIWFYLDVTSEDGTVTNWAISGGAPGQLMRRGIFKSVLEDLGEARDVPGVPDRDR